MKLVIEQLQLAIELREANQDGQARALLLTLQREYPDDPHVNYQCAWVHDKLGLEREAVPFYEKAIAQGLSGEDLKGALLGLGSTYRSLGMYEESVALLRKAVAQFPEERQMQLFLALALYNVGEHHEAMSLLIRNLVETSADEGIQRYRTALLFYADDLDQTW